MTDSQYITSGSVLRRFIAYIKPYRARLALGVVAGLVCGGSLYGVLQSMQNVFTPWDAVSTVVVDDSESTERTIAERIAEKFDIQSTTSDGQMTWQFMILGLVAFPVLMLLRAFAIYVNKFCMRWIGASVVRDLRDEMFKRLQSQSLKFFGKSDVGQLISKCTNDTTVVEQLVSVTISAVTIAPIEIIAATTFVIVQAVRYEMLGLLTMVFIAFPLCIIPIVVLGRIVKRHMQQALAKISNLVSRMHENFTGVRIVKAFNMEDKENERFVKMNADYFSSIIRALRAELMMTPMMEVVAIVLGCIFFVACYATGVKLSQIMSITIAAMFAYRPIKHVAQINANIQRGRAAVERIFALIDADTSIPESPDAVTIEKFADSVVFENVSFRYEDNEPEVIDNVSIEISAGTVVALVGETGSGKTTLANILARFYDPSEGRVLLDGRDLRDIEIASLRKIIGVVTQETILFNETVANNISYGTENATDDEIIEAAKKANAHEFIMSVPEGYDRVVGEKGFVLSGGERQRIALARAILRNPPILILDEATSALDTVTERQVQEAIARVMEGRTVFAIAHRLSTVRNANQILLVEDGRIAERGTHDELYEAGGHYRTLCDMQMV